MWYIVYVEYAAIEILPSESNILINQVELKVLSVKERKEMSEVSALIIFLKPIAKIRLEIAGT